MQRLLLSVPRISLANPLRGLNSAITSRSAARAYHNSPRVLGEKQRRGTESSFAFPSDRIYTTAGFWESDLMASQEKSQPRQQNDAKRPYSHRNKKMAKKKARKAEKAAAAAAAAAGEADGGESSKKKRRKSEA